MKKLLLGIGTLAAVVAPIATVVACSGEGSAKNPAMSPTKHIKEIMAGQPQELKDKMTAFMSRYQNHELTPLSAGTFVINRSIYFDNGDIGTIAVTDFYVQDNGDYSLTINKITDTLVDKGIDISGSYETMYVTGNINIKGDFHAQSGFSDKMYIRSLSSNTTDKWVYFPEGRSQTVLSVGTDWKNFLEDKIGDVIKDKSKSAQDVFDACTIELKKYGLKLMSSSTNPGDYFTFNSTNRELMQAYVSKIA